MSFRISLAGDLGSGKTTVAKILQQRFGVEIISGGKVQRELASKMGLTIEEFNVFMENDPSFDRKLDDMFVAYNDRAGDYIFDCRMGWYFVPSAVSFYLHVDPMEAARRVFNANRADESFESVEKAYESLTGRRVSEAKRYKDYYGQDIMDMSNYNFVIDTTNLTPEEVAEEIVKDLSKVGV